MVISSLMLLALFAAGSDIPQIFLVLALLNAVAAAYIYKIIPEFLFRFVAWVLAHVLYRLRVVGVAVQSDHGGDGADRGRLGHSVCGEAQLSSAFEFGG